MAIAMVSLCLSGEALPGQAEPAREETPVRAAPVRIEHSAYMLDGFGKVSLLRPTGEPRGVVLFLSDRAGWTAAMAAQAESLARQGLLVAGVSAPALMKAENAYRGSSCINPNYALMRLSADVQHRAGVQAYSKPIIVGEGLGATIAYGSLAQWSNGSYQGVVSVNFTPSLSSRKSWCRTPGFALAPAGHPATLRRFTPIGEGRVPWRVIQPSGASASIRSFVQASANARLVDAGTAAGMTQDASGQAALNQTVLSLLPARLNRAETGPLPVPDMPLTLLPPSGPAQRNDLMAIIYSGDGGWAGIDRDIAGQLSLAGIPVVGVDSLSYFWTARTPAGAGHDLGQLINAFSQHWGRPHVLLIGYSFGADAMPYMVDHLDAAAKAKISRVSLLGFSSTADFQFHLGSWLNISSDTSLPTLPAVAQMKGMSVQCVRGATEAGSACAAIPHGVAEQYVVPGDHHFNRNAPLLTRIILGQQKPGTIASSAN